MSARKHKQASFFPPSPTAYGGSLRNTRKGRAGPRPLSTKQSMHLVLRSTRAKGRQSFATPKNRRKVDSLLQKFARRYSVKIHSFANVGNHIHIHLQLSSLRTYNAFIRGITAAIAMAVAGTSRWKKSTEKFWDLRPFTRVVEKGRRAFQTLQNYVRINQIEGTGVPRNLARFEMEFESGAYD